MHRRAPDLRVPVIGCDVDQAAAASPSSPSRRRVRRRFLCLRLPQPSRSAPSLHVDILGPLTTPPGDVRSQGSRALTGPGDSKEGPPPRRRGSIPLRKRFVSPPPQSPRAPSVALGAHGSSLSTSRVRFEAFTTCRSGRRSRRCHPLRLSDEHVGDFVVNRIREPRRAPLVMPCVDVRLDVSLGWVGLRSPTPLVASPLPALILLLARSKRTARRRRTHRSRTPG